MNSNQTSISQNAESGTYAEWPPERRLPLLKNRKIKYFMAILLVIILATTAIILTIHYVKRQEKETLSGQFSFMHNVVKSGNTSGISFFSGF
jgi:hypothetical protein